jgi:glucose dehydrogenase
VVYAVSKDGQVICAARESGQIYWMKNLNEASSPSARRDHGCRRPEADAADLVRPAALQRPLLIVGQTGEMVVMNAKTGEIQKRVEMKGASSLADRHGRHRLCGDSRRADLIAIR